MASRRRQEQIGKVPAFRDFLFKNEGQAFACQLTPPYEGVAEIIYDTTFLLGQRDYRFSEGDLVPLPKFLIPAFARKDPRLSHLGAREGAIKLHSRRITSPEKALDADKHCADLFPKRCSTPISDQPRDGLLWAWLRQVQPRLFPPERAGKFQCFPWQPKHLRSYAAGEPIVSQGTPWDGFYFVLDGCASVFYCGKNDKERSLNLLRSGDLFGDDEAPFVTWMKAKAPREVERTFGVTVKAGHAREPEDPEGEKNLVAHFDAGDLAKISMADSEFGFRAYSYWRDRNLAWRVQDSADDVPLRPIAIVAGQFLLEEARRGTPTAEDTPNQIFLSLPDVRIGFHAKDPGADQWQKLAVSLLKAGVDLSLTQNTKEALLGETPPAGRNLPDELAATARAPMVLRSMVEAALGLRWDIAAPRRSGRHAQNKEEGGS